MSAASTSPKDARSNNIDTGDAISSSSRQSPKPLPQGEESHDTPQAPVQAKSSVMKRVWKKMGINGLVVMIMVKPAIAATISMAIYQSQRVAVNYLNLGYLIIIVSVTTVPILPRGKFLLNFFLSVFLACFGAAMVLLGHWSAIKARQHTTPANASPAVRLGYNSSASVVNAIFLMFNLFVISVLRATRPVLSIPSIQYTIFMMVGFTYGPQEPNMKASIRLVKELLYAFLTGQAISAAVSLLIIPVSSRKVFFGEATGFLQTCRGLLKAQLAFVQALDHSNMVKPTITNERAVPEDESKSPPDTSKLYQERAKVLQGVTTGLLSLGAKLRDDVVFAKREAAYGHLLESDIHLLHQLIRDIMIPISGLSTVADISDRMHRSINEDGHMPASISNAIPTDALEDEHKEWLELISGLVLSFQTIVQVLDESIVHILVLLGLIPAPPKTSNGDDIEKGPEESYGDMLEKRIEGFRTQRSTELQLWAEERGLNSVFKTTTKNNNTTSLPSPTSAASPREVLASKRLHIILYMEFLLYSVSKAILALVRFAELKVSSGALSKKRFIFPAIKTLVKWAKGIITGDGPSPDNDAFEQLTGSAPVIQLGDSFSDPRDPEHLPPKNKRQAWGNEIRKIPKFLGSEAVSFGARVTVAVMSVGIMAFLKNTHAFFVQQRVVWCLVMIAIGMSPTAGSAVFNLLGNLTCTLFGMVGAYVNWYIVDGKTAGVIVFFFFIQMFYFYWAAKYPRFLVAIVAGALTHVLIIGYELQTRVIGHKIATATGQPFYPIYLLAPYRLLTVAAGVTVAYIWTIFPVPITSASVLRRDLGNSLFLLANYVSSVTATVDQRLVGDGDADAELRDRLARMRHQVLAKQIAVLDSMRLNIGFLDWEPRLGGEFPKGVYEEIVGEVQKVTSYLTIIAYASRSFHKSPTPSTWLTAFSTARPTSHATSHTLVTLLALLSSSITNAQPLPPYLKPPSSIRLSDDLLSSENEILDLRNVNEPGFRAVAVIEVAQRAMIESTGKIVGLVRELVGEVDFGWRVLDGGLDGV